VSFVGTYAAYARTVLVERPWQEFGLPTRGRVSDIGNGPGWSVQSLRTLGLDVIGLDLVPVSPETICGNATRLPFRDSSLDGVLCLRTLHHIEADQQALAEFYRVLRPKGFVLLAVANRMSYTLIAGRCLLSLRVPNPNDRHYHTYTPTSIRRRLRSSGFMSIRVRACHYLPRFLGSLAGIAETFAAADLRLGTNRLTSLFGPLLLATGRKQA